MLFEHVPSRSRVMQQNVLLGVAVCVSLIGAVVLFVLSPEISPQDTLLRGEITAIRSTGKVWFIDVVPEELTVVSFDPVNASGHHELVGRLASYEGRVEFIVEGVR